MKIKKVVKYTLISILSLIAVVLLVVTVVLYCVFDKEKLTAYLQDHVGEYVECPVEIGGVELTFFSSFPDFCIHVEELSLINPMEGSVNDTLLHVTDLYAQVDVMDYLNDDKISVTAFNLQRGLINIYVDEQGNENFNVCPALLGDSEEESESSPLDKLKLEGIEISGFSASFLDRKHNLEARVDGLNAVLESQAELLHLKGNVDLSVSADEIFYSDSLNFAQIYDFHFANCKLWSDGWNATLQLDQLKAASQEYLLSGDTGLMAQIWNFNLHDIDLKWMNSRPTVSLLTQLDSATMTMGDEDLLYVNVGPSAIEAPVTSNDTLISVQVKTRLEHLSVSMDSEGDLIADRTFDTRFLTTTNWKFNDFHVMDMSTSLGSQTIGGEAHFNMADTAHMVGAITLNLKDTPLSALLAIIPESYMPDLSGMELKVDLKNTRLGVDLAICDDQFLLNEVKVNGTFDKFSYADNSNLKAQSDAINYMVTYPNSQKRSYADISFNAPNFSASVDDTIQVALAKPSGKVKADFENYGNRIKVNSNLQTSGLQLAMGNELKGSTQNAKLRLNVLYDDRKEDIFEMLHPDLDADLNQANFQLAGVEYPIELPRVDCSFNENLLDVRQSEVLLGNSHLTLKGKLTNLADYLNDKGMLTGEFNLGGPLVDADQLLAMVSGVGVDSLEMAETPVAVADSLSADSTQCTLETADPFIVPKGVDFVLNTHVDQIRFNGNPFNDVAGKITCQDGVMVLEQVGFTSNAADMQLTALYKSPRRNNLFVGWNFHLLNIDIAEMIRLVPEIDSIAPMLKSFAGKAEFHLAGETNLFADYSPKMSTLKAVAAVEGQDLTVLDNETFQTIKKYLFKDCTTNKIDSMSIELAVARKKMTLYPMLISWDRYQAVLSGNHTIVNDMPFNYHISITKCPVVGGHLGLDITGNLDDVDNISFKVGSCKYANLYRPERRNITQQQTLELKELISTSLKKTVK